MAVVVQGEIQVEGETEDEVVAVEVEDVVEGEEDNELGSSGFQK